MVSRREEHRVPEYRTHQIQHKNCQPCNPRGNVFHRWQVSGSQSGVVSFRQTDLLLFSPRWWTEHLAPGSLSERRARRGAAAGDHGLRPGRAARPVSLRGAVGFRDFAPKRRPLAITGLSANRLGYRQPGGTSREHTRGQPWRVVAGWITG